MGMQFNAVTLDSSLKLIEYCSTNNVSLEEVSRSRKIAEYEVDVMKIFGFCKKLGWLEDSGGEINITEKASEILILEKPPEMLRRMLDMVFNSQNVFWRRFLSRGRKEAKFFLEGNQLQVLEWCGLFEEGDHISDWWLDQRTYSNEEEEIENAKTGRKGERKTLIYEEARTRRKPEWTALELGDGEGYDVLSWTQESGSSNRLRIEVKSSRDSIERARMFLTRNEWEIATSAGDHVFHLWTDVDKESSMLRVVSVEEMAENVSKDVGEGVWESVQIPMRVFSHIKVVKI